MRTKLAERFGETITVSGTVCKRDQSHSKARGRVLTYCIKRLTCDGEVIDDHIWINQTSAIRRAKVWVGDTIQFEADIIQYLRGYMKFRYKEGEVGCMSPDYGLSGARKVKVLTRGKNHVARN